MDGADEFETVRLIVQRDGAGKPVCVTATDPGENRAAGDSRRDRRRRQAA